ncbi:hypothetical protein GAY31_17440 [Azospirillum brasilense]|nr:hypothetical protein [Azospirillum brasilense]
MSDITNSVIMRCIPAMGEDLIGDRMFTIASLTIVFSLMLSTKKSDASDFIETYDCDAFSKAYSRKLSRDGDKPDFIEKATNSKKIECLVATGHPTKDYKNIALARYHMSQNVYLTEFSYQVTLWLFEAIEYYEKQKTRASAIAYSFAQVDLGKIAEREKNFDEAVSYYEKAAWRGNQYGKYKLAIAYRDGNGKRRDFIKAYAWFSLTASYSNGLFSKEAREELDALEKRMTVEQVASAQITSSEYEEIINTNFEKDSPK